MQHSVCGVLIFASSDMALSCTTFATYIFCNVAEPALALLWPKRQCLQQSFTCGGL